MFDWKKLKHWRVGPFTFEVDVVKKIPECPYEKGAFEDSNAVMDIGNQKIYIVEGPDSDMPSLFLTNLFHELNHIVGYFAAPMEFNDLVAIAEKSRKEELKDAVDEVRNEVQSIRTLEFLRDNAEQIRYVLDLLTNQERSCHGARKQRAAKKRGKHRS